ncbi:MAG TPA: hypothetical protein PKM64_05480 [Thermoanaerobaculia bacterium]|nr:hypothetical protein [Thermoanaerobaculia bacterium]
MRPAAPSGPIVPNALAREALVRPREACQILGVRARSTLYRWQERGLLPARLSVSRRVTGWPLAVLLEARSRLAAAHAARPPAPWGPRSRVDG